MERVARVFDSFTDAERADDEYYAKLSGPERVDILLELIERYEASHGQAAAGFERVYRIVEFERG